MQSLKRESLHRVNASNIHGSESRSPISGQTGKRLGLDQIDPG